MEGFSERRMDAILNALLSAAFLKYYLYEILHVGSGTEGQKGLGWSADPACSLVQRA